MRFSQYEPTTACRSSTGSVSQPRTREGRFRFVLKLKIEVLPTESMTASSEAVLVGLQVRCAMGPPGKLVLGVKCVESLSPHCAVLGSTQRYRSSRL